MSSMQLVKLVAPTPIVGPFRRQDAPYIRPTKFVPVLDYFSSSDRDVSDQEQDGIKAKWEPGKSSYEQDQQLSKWRKVTYDVPPSTRKMRRDSLSSLVDHSMQEMNKQFKSNISQFSQGLCYNHMERKIQSDLGGGASEQAELPSVKGCGGDESIAEDGSGANPLIYFKYDFGYEFGIANPRNVRASSEPPAKALPSNQSRKSKRPTSLIADAGEDEDDDRPIELPIIHETTTSAKK
ncbi:hypothetical protein Ocin01_10983 [Orchesella cincta]|uniref:Uncharacterized protein n=1 Tax=Orchesella cincta TaxID=48709 RepID=A0A1D2MRJ4_ORCCI|nr:hypothetical protein Ocin01_10983 [Orchesella cincta]